MTKKKKLALLLLPAVLLIAACCWFGSRYLIINAQIVSRSASALTLQGDSLPAAGRLQKLPQLETLDLRSLPVTAEDYETLQRQLPECRILWSVPFHGAYADSSSTELSAAELSREDMEALAFFPELQVLDARGCRDYEALSELQSRYPSLRILYTVALGSLELREDAVECTVSDDTVWELIEQLPYLPALRSVNADACRDYEAVAAIRRARPDLDVRGSVVIGGVPYADDASSLLLKISDAEEALELLQYFPSLSEVRFNGLAEDNELMFRLKSRYPDLLIQWRFTLFGVETESTARELILNDIPMESTQAVEDALKYFYCLERVEMCRCGISSEEMDALWKRHPETRFVWAIPMGDGFVRTDVKAFIPFKYGFHIYNPFYDAQAKELKYLVDLECLDIGHMRMRDISFLQYMPKLRYLVLADLECEDFSSIAGLTELVYLELFRTKFDDVSLLLNMTKLEDLNIGWTDLKNPELLMQMTWLKRLWATKNGMTPEQFRALHEALPDTEVYTVASHPTDGGWRQAQRYYEMRDMLDMFYMK